MNNEPSKESIKRFLDMLAFFNEAHPSDNPRVNDYWGKLREGKYCMKYGV